MTPSALLAPARPQSGRVKTQEEPAFCPGCRGGYAGTRHSAGGAAPAARAGGQSFPGRFPPGWCIACCHSDGYSEKSAVQDTYLLMADAKITQSDATTRAIPDRLLTASASDSRVVSTTGTQTIPGTQARGTLLFDNSSHQSFFLQSGTPFMASDSVQVVLAQAVTIPPRQDGADGTISAPALAAAPGAAGNIAAGALATTCCNNQVVVSNSQAFSGGTDPHTVHIVAQADLNSAQNALTPGLEKQALQKIQRQLAASEVKAGSPVFSRRKLFRSAGWRAFGYGNSAGERYRDCDGV